MDLVDKQHVIGFEIGQDSGQIAGPFQNRPGRLPEIDAHFTGDDMGQRGFAQSGRPEEQGMVQRFITFFGCRNEDFELFACFMLPDIFVEQFRAQGPFDRFLVRRSGRGIDNSFFAEVVRLNAHT